MKALIFFIIALFTLNISYGQTLTYEKTKKLSNEWNLTRDQPRFVWKKNCTRNAVAINCTDNDDLTKITIKQKGKNDVTETIYHKELGDYTGFLILNFDKNIKKIDFWYEGKSHLFILEVTLTKRMFRIFGKKRLPDLHYCEY